MEWKEGKRGNKLREGRRHEREKETKEDEERRVGDWIKEKTKMNII